MTNHARGGRVRWRTGVLFRAAGMAGAYTGLVGAGGGFLVVPALALLGGLPMPVATGTSLLVIAMKSAAGFAGYLATVQIDWTLPLAVTGFAVVGSLAGARLAGCVPARPFPALRLVVLAMGTSSCSSRRPPT